MKNLVQILYPVANAAAPAYSAWGFQAANNVALEVRPIVPLGYAAACAAAVSSQFFTVTL